MRYAFLLDGRTYHVTLEEHADGPRFLVEGDVFAPKVTKNGAGYGVEVDGQTFHLHVRNGRIEMDKAPLDLEIRRAKPQLTRVGGKGRKQNGSIKPPMPGKVVEVHVKVGDSIEEGAPLLVLEAMKMQNDLKSPLTGTVTQVNVRGGQNVEASTVMVVIEPNTGE